MARAVAAPAQKLGKSERAILLPNALAGSNWQLWTLAGSRPRLIDPDLDLAANRWAAQTVLALPAREVFCLALWLPASRGVELREMVALQLEVRRLSSPGVTPIFDFSVVETREARQLVCVGVLPEDVPEHYRANRYAGFDLAARYQKYPPESLTLWAEQGRLTAAFTRGDELAYFQALGSERIEARLVEELVCLREVLALTDVVVRIDQINLTFETTAMERNSLAQALQVPVRTELALSLSAPAQTWRLMPREVTAAKQARRTRRWRRQILGLIVGFILACIFLLIGRLAYKINEISKLQRAGLAQAPALALIESTQATWREVTPVVDPTQNPLENLLNAASVMPPAGLRLTLFDQKDGQVLIHAEAKDATLAYQFLTNLKQSPDLTHYTWQMTEPHLLPNDLAEIEIQGDHEAAHAQ